MIRGYIRVSTARQAEDGVSLEAQEARLRTWAAWAHVGAAVELYRDAGMSGGRADNRPGLQAALADCVAGDALVVYSLSRLARSTEDTLAIANTLARAGADLVSLTEQIDTRSAAGKMFFRLLAVLSEFERDVVAERTAAALAHIRAGGSKTGGPVPFGYRADEEGRLSEEPGEIKAIQLMKTLKNSGCSLRAIARELTARGIRTRQGGPWRPQVIADLCKVA